MRSSLISHQHLMNANAEQEQALSDSLIGLAGQDIFFPAGCGFCLSHAASSPPMRASTRANFPVSASVVS